MATPKQKCDIFVIMPFSRTPTRNKAQLTAFFESHIKDPIEKARLKFRYRVRRSDDTFNITEQIIRDLYHADIVIADLSGKESNPNVMYELGIRLGLSDKPVILIREAHKDNKTIFDISGFFAHPYDPLNYQGLVKHLKDKLKAFEQGDEVYHSPVLSIVKQDIPILQKISVNRADQLLDAMTASLIVTASLFSTNVSQYIKQKNKSIKIPGKFTQIMDFLKFIEDESNKLKKIDWSGFHWSFGAQPTIDHYISNRYLIGLIDKDIEGPFTAYLITYYAHFVATTFYQGEWNPTAVWKFIGESTILTNNIRGLRFLLTSNDKNEIIKIRKKILDNIKHSHLGVILN